MRRRRFRRLIRTQTFCKTWETVESYTEVDDILHMSKTDCKRLKDTYVLLENDSVF